MRNSDHGTTYTYTALRVLPIFRVAILYDPPRDSENLLAACLDAREQRPAQRDTSLLTIYWSEPGWVFLMSEVTLYQKQGCQVPARLSLDVRCGQLSQEPR